MPRRLTATGFADDRGHIVVGGEFEQYRSIGICSQERGWCGENQAFFTNPDNATNGQPRYIIGPNGTSANTSLTGMLVPCTVFAGVLHQRPGGERSPDAVQPGGHRAHPL